MTDDDNQYVPSIDGSAFEVLSFASRLSRITTTTSTFWRARAPAHATVDITRERMDQTMISIVGDFRESYAGSYG
ncbi:MAG: uncharacterized protein KVP18_004526 [Porospora cf. gigantea A]|uniref:uncharacterized protein n=1 Tax=Porospora cf. gigantea A TaxID=2853593 RepID=UPI00355A3B00|nr:MAG: hypothetical protein KVP18_004526 [Porospora cf. gigantea A]